MLPCPLLRQVETVGRLRPVPRPALLHPLHLQLDRHPEYTAQLPVGGVDLPEPHRQRALLFHPHPHCVVSEAGRESGPVNRVNNTTLQMALRTFLGRPKGCGRAQPSA